MKKRFGLLLATLLIASTAAFAGCNMLGGSSSSEESAASSVTTSSPAESSSQTPATFTVTFDTDGGSTVDPVTVTEGEKATKPTAPTKTGYAFAGWYLGETEFDFDTTEITTDVTLTAKWNVNKYTLTLNLDNGEAPIVVENVEYGTALKDIDFQMTQPEKTGYTFDGITLNGTAVTGEELVTDNYTFEVVWTVVEYTATVGEVGQTAEDVKFTVENRTEKLAYIQGKLPEDTAEFDYEWVVAPNAELALNNEQAFTYTKTTKTYTVTFDQGVTAQTIEYGAKATKPEDPTAPTNFRFDGWFEDGAQTAFDFENTTITGNVVLTAKFTQTHSVVTVTVNVENAGGTYDSQVALTETVALNTQFDVPANIKDNAPDGYYFDEAQSNVISGTVSADGLALSVYFTKYRTVTVNGNGGTVANETLQVKKGVNLPALDASKTGYAVATWVNAENNSVVNGETIVNSDMTVKPIWKVAGTDYVLGSDVALAKVSGYESIISISDKSHTEDGTGSLKVLENGQYPGVYVTLDKTAEEIATYDYVTFWIYVDSDVFVNETNRRIVLYFSDHIQVKANEWVQISLSGAEFASKFSANPFPLLFMMNEGHVDYDQSCCYYIDELVFANREYAADEIDYCDTNESLKYFSRDSYGSLDYTTEMSHTADGTGSIVRSDASGWANTYLKVGKTADEIKAFDNVSFWVYMVSDRQPDNLFLYGDGNMPYAVTTGQWVEIVRPASEFADHIVNGQVTLFWFEGYGRSQTITVYIDEMKLVNKPVAPADEIEYCENNESLENFSRDGYGSLGYTTEMSHTNDGTGSIVRSDASGWANTYLKVGKTADEIKAFDYVSFWVYMVSDRQPDNLFLYGDNNMPYAVTTGQWVEIVRPASEFADHIVNGQVTLFWFEGYGRSQTITVYIDEIKLMNVAEEVVDMCVAGVAGNTFTPVMCLTVVGNVHGVTHDGNGSCYMQEAGGWPYVNMTLTETQIAKLDQYEFLTWWVYVDCASEAEGATQDVKYVDINWNTTRVNNKEWTKISFSCEALKTALNGGNSFTIFYVNRVNAGEKYFIDDIRFEGLKQA